MNTEVKQSSAMEFPRTPTPQDKSSDFDKELESIDRMMNKNKPDSGSDTETDEDTETETETDEDTDTETDEDTDDDDTNLIEAEWDTDLIMDPHENPVLRSFVYGQACRRNLNDVGTESYTFATPEEALVEEISEYTEWIGEQRVKTLRKVKKISDRALKKKKKIERKLERAKDKVDRKMIQAKVKFTKLIANKIRARRKALTLKIHKHFVERK